MRGRSSGFIFSLVSLGCRPSTPRGTIEEFDLSARLPPDVIVPADTTAWQGTVSVCTLRGPVRLRVRWRSFTSRGVRYVSSYAVEMEDSMGGIVVELGRPALRAGKDVAMVTVGFAVDCVFTPFRGEARTESAWVEFDPVGAVAAKG